MKFKVQLEDGSGCFYAEARVDASSVIQAMNLAKEAAHDLQWYPYDLDCDLSDTSVVWVIRESE